MMAPLGSSRSNSSAIPACLNACRVWSDEDLCNIDSGEVIGRTDMSDEEITRGMSGWEDHFFERAKSECTDYIDLRQDWTYMPVFWNCHDLAIRLAYIIVRPSMDVIMILKRLMMSLRQACYKEINWSSTAGKVCIGGWGAAAIGGLASVPPLAIAGVGVFMVGWTVGFFGGFAVSAKEKARYQFMIKLEEKFPQLKSLHN